MPTQVISIPGTRALDGPWPPHPGQLSSQIEQPLHGACSHNVPQSHCCTFSSEIRLCVLSDLSRSFWDLALRLDP